MKHIFQKLTAFTLLFCLFLQSFAYDCEVDGICYNLNQSDNTASVTVDDDGEHTYSGNISIPSHITYNGTLYSVTAIGDYAFSLSYQLYSVSIPESIKTIGEKAFIGCDELSSITIPNSVTSIGDDAFFDCTGLASVTIPNSVTTIGRYAFDGCSGLTSVTIGNSVTSIGEGVFQRCTGLSNVIIPNSVTTIGDFAFYSCNGLTSVTIPNSVRFIGYEAFGNCYNLDKLIIPDIAAWCEIKLDGNVWIDNHHSIYSDEYTEIKDLVIPEGVKKIGDNAFIFCNSLTSITLPNSIEDIGECAFLDCDNLSSVTINSLTPPYGLGSFYEYSNLVIYVPLEALDLYIQDLYEYGLYDYTGNITILPVQNNMRSITVSFPEGTNVQDYANMFLELNNTKNDQFFRYVMTDRNQYTFPNINQNTSWNIVLKNEHDDVFGMIDNVELHDKDISVTFTTLSKPQHVKVFVQTPDGKDVTDQTQITWTNAQGNYLAQGASLSGLPIDYQANYRVVLSQELAMVYETPHIKEYELKDGDNNVVCKLETINQIQLSGKVKDAVTGMPLSGAVVSASQTFGGKYSKTLNAKTDKDGLFTMEIAVVPTSVTFAATDYISQTIDYDNGFDELDCFVVPDVSLQSIKGATIAVDFTYTSVDGETQGWYSDYQNVGFELFNVTKNLIVSQFNVQYPQIVLLEDVDDGDVLRLTAKSRTNAFMPVETTVTIEEQTAQTTFDIIEFGRIKASFKKTGNAQVVGSLYDNFGKLVKTQTYSEALFTVSNLTDGKYTLVTMGYSPFFNTIYDIDQLPLTGLTEGKDYVKNTVEVMCGYVSEVNIAEVPELDESKLYYTGEKTSFTVNKPSIVVGNYLTLTGHIDFKPTYDNIVSNVQMIVDLPESCQFVENSVMVGNSTSGYTLNGNRIIIPMTHYTDRVRFCVIPTLGGDYAPSAFTQFDLSGKTIMQPIGSANYTAKDVSINVPSTVAKTSIPISGTATSSSSIGVYDNDVLIGQTTSLINGTWATTCELNNPYNLSTHSIYAKVITKAGLELQSETVECMYDMNAIEVKTVTMINNEVVVVFNFQNNTTSETFYNYTQKFPEFTFLVDFTNNDSTKVWNVIVNVFTDHNDVKQLKASYNREKDKWVAVSSFPFDNLPINVSVSFNAYVNPILDMFEFYQMMDEISQSCNDFTHYREIINTINYEQLSSEELTELLKKLDNEYADEDLELSEEYLESLSEDELSELEAYYESIIGDSLSSDLIIEDLEFFLNLFCESQYYTITLDDGTIVSISQYKDDDKDALIEAGYDVFETRSGGMLYYYSDEYTEIYIETEHNKEIRVQRTAKLSTTRKISEQDYQDDIHKFQVLISDLKDKIEPFEDIYKKALEALNLAVDDIYNKFLAASLEAELSVSLLNKEKTKYRNLQLQWIRIAQEEGVGSLNYSLQEARLRECSKWVNTYRNQLHFARIRKFLAKTTYKFTKRLPNFFKKKLPLAKYLTYISDGVEVISDFSDLYSSIPRPCKADELGADKCRSDAIKAAVWCEGAIALKIGLNAMLDYATIGQLAAAIPSGGVSAVTGVCTFILNLVGSYLIEKGYDAYIKKMKENLIVARESLRCDTNPLPPLAPPHPPCPHVPPMMDPSGYVYEGVSSNRLQGVMATAYYKEMVEDMYGDLHENIVKWDAMEYAQENPLFTDEYGMYAWDVPQGLWQVKFEKEGYETVYSDWLPVPPPQLDINIEMRQNRQPEVTIVRAFESAVEVEFDKYMQSDLLTTDNIIVMQGGKPVLGTIELVNNEMSSGVRNQSFASLVRFNSNLPFTEKEITLFVSNRVKSYTGIQMQDDYQQTFTIEKEIKEIQCDPLTTVSYGEKALVSVEVLPASSSTGKMLSARSSSPMILGVETEEVVIGNDGKAEVIIFGELPGSATLLFSVEGINKTAVTNVQVKQTLFPTIETPIANIASGTVVDKGTKIYLSCESEGVTIYYTLDGSCPCDNTAARMVYDGTPIVINETTIIQTMAVATDMTESDVAVFTYIVEGTDIEDVTKDPQIEIYPIPIRDKLNVTAGGKMVKGVIVSSMNGVLIASSTKQAKKVTLDINKIPPGVYMISVTTEDGLFGRKFLKVQ